MCCPLVSSGSERKDIERLDARIGARGHAGGDEHGLIAERCDLALIVSHDSALVRIGLAAAVGGKDMVELLLANRADVNSKAIDGETALHEAANNGRKDVVKLLLANKADVNAKASIGWTPLHFAAMRCHRDVVELLLASKADVNAEDGGGGTPLRDAARNCNDVTELLRQHGGHD